MSCLEIVQVKFRGGGAGWAFAHPVFREQNRNSLTSNLQSIKMKICRVVPILDTVGHITNYTWIGPAVIANLIKILFASYSWYSWSCDHLHLARQDIIFKAIPCKVDHMTNCIWISPAASQFDSF